VTQGVGPASPVPSSPARFGPWRREVQAFLELLAVTGLTVARPTFGILTNNAEIFVTRQTQPAELVTFAFLLVLVPPLALWIVEVAIGAVLPRARRAAHTVLVSIVAGVFVLAVLKKQTDVASGVLIAVAVVAAGACAWIVWRSAIARLFLRYLAVAPILFALLFLTSASVSSSVFEPDPGLARVTFKRPHRVVMVVFDEFPEASLLNGQGAIDADLFPNFAALASTSTWYRNATTVAPYTGAAVPSILTGLYKAGGTDVQVAANAPRNLFTLLGGSFRINAVETGTRLCPAAVCTPHREGSGAQLWDLMSVSRELWWDEASPERVTTSAFSGGDILGDSNSLATGEQFARSLQPSRQPRLDYMHVLLPHQGWHYLPSGQDYLEDTAAPGLYWDYTWGSEWAGMLAQQRHLLQVGAADRLLGQIVTRLRRIGAYDNTLLVVTADHGIAFHRRQPIRGVSRQNFPQIAWVPMLVKAPRQTRAVVDDLPAKTIDLLPTIADDLGGKMPWRIDGRTLLGPRRRDGPLKLLQWDHNVVKPDRHGFIHIPGPPGFAIVKGERAWTQGGPVAQRLYRVGPYGALLGRDAKPLTGSRLAGATATLDDPARFRSVHPRARRAPWTYISGTIHGDVPADASLAITVNGVVAGLSGAYLDPLKPDQRSFWGMLEPGAFRRGENDIGVSVIKGSPELAPLTMTR
jgi:hypothetical protein